MLSRSVARCVRSMPSRRFCQGGGRRKGRGMFRTICLGAAGFGALVYYDYFVDPVVRNGMSLSENLTGIKASAKYV